MILFIHSQHTGHTLLNRKSQTEKENPVIYCFTFHGDMRGETGCHFDPNSEKDSQSSVASSTTSSTSEPSINLGLNSWSLTEAGSSRLSCSATTSATKVALAPVEL